MVLTRATLVGVSTACIGVVIETLVQLLEELSRPYTVIIAHPIHTLHSELYVLELVAECCATHWASVNPSKDADAEDSDSDSESSASNAPPESSYNRRRRASKNKLLERGVPPDPLDDALIRRLLEVLKLFLTPLSDTYILPATNILDDVFKGIVTRDTSFPEYMTGANGNLNDNELPKLLLENSHAIETYTQGIVEYISVSNWSRVLEYIKAALRTSHPVVGNAAQTNPPA